MAQQLTRDEFKKRFGLWPEEYEQENPDFVAPIPTKKPARRYGATTPVDDDGGRAASLDAYLAGPEQIPTPVKEASQPVKTNEKPYKPSSYIVDNAVGEADAFMDLVNEIDDPAIRKDLGEFVAADTKRSIDQSAKTEQLAKNAASGVLQIPAGIPATFDLVRFGVPAVIKSFTDVDPRVNRFKQIANEFVSGMMPPEVQEELATHLQEKIAEFKTAVPDATPEQTMQFTDQYQDSQEFFDELTSRLPAGFRMAQYANDWANKTVGLGRPDEQTVIDDLEQVLGQSIVGIPTSAIKAAKDRIAKIAGERVANSATLKVAGRVAELATPATLPYTPGNVAANAGVGAVITEAGRYATNQPSLLNGTGPVTDVPELAPAAPLEHPDGHGTDIGGQIDSDVLAGGATVGAIFSLPLFRRQIVDQAVKSAQDEAVSGVNDAVANTVRTVQRDALNAGPSLPEQSRQMEPNLGPQTGLADTNSPAKRLVEKYKDEGDTESQWRVDNAMSSGTTVSRMEKEARALNFGIFDNSKDSVAFRELSVLEGQMDEPTRQLFNNYIYGMQRRQDNDLYTKSLQDAIRLQQIDYDAARARGDNRSATPKLQKLQELQQRLEQTLADDPSTRSSLRDASRSDIDRWIAEGEANPQVKQLGDMFKKASNDLIDYRVANGLLTEAEGQVMKANRSLHVPLRERERSDVTNPIKRQALLFKDRVFPNKADDSGAMYTSNAERNITGEGAVVNRPKPAIEAIRESVMEAVRAVTANNARREVIDILDALPNARGRVLRPYEFDMGAAGKRTELSPAQYAKFREHAKSFDPSKYVRVQKNGKIQLWEFADEAMAKSLQFAPLATVPVFNATRKFWQQMTTGLGAPWFALKSGFWWDPLLGKTTIDKGRSLGLVDTYARRLFNGTALEKPVGAIMDHVYDPTVFLSALGAMPYQMSYRAIKEVATKIEEDLVSKSGVFNALAQVPAMKPVLEKMSTSMAAMFDRSVYNVFQRNLSTSMGHLHELSRVKESYKRGRMGAVTAPAKLMYNMYAAAIESMQNATRVAFFAENYGRLKQLHGENIPKRELDKLVYDTRNLTGDMSRTSLSPSIQRLTSVIPYGNPIIQGTRHILSSAVGERRSSKFWSQLMSGVLLPKLGALYVLSQWEGAEDYWYNKTPEWEQQNFAPFPTAEALRVYAETGQFPVFDPQYIEKVPVAPEFSIFTAPVEAGLRSLGLIGTAKNHLPGGLGNDLLDAFGQLTSFATPPIAQAFAAANGVRMDIRAGLTGNGFIQQRYDAPVSGANNDQMTFNSSYSRVAADIVGALAGTSAHLAMQTLNVGTISAKEGNDFATVLSDATDTFKYEVQRRMPPSPVPGLYDSLNREYAMTPESQYVFKTLGDLEPVFNQLQVERDKKGRVADGKAQGLEVAKKINEPLLRDLAQQVYDTVNKKGPFKQAAESYTDQRAFLDQLEASRVNWPERAYHEKRNEIVRTQQRLKAQQARILTELEKRIKVSGGDDAFKQVYGEAFSYQALAKAIRQNVDR